MSHLVPFVVPSKPHDADESKKKSILLGPKDKRLPPLPPPSSPKSLVPLQAGGNERALSCSASTPRASSIKRNLSSSQHPVYSIKLMPLQNTDHPRSTTAPPQPKCPSRRIIRRKLGEVLPNPMQQLHRSHQYHDPPALRPPEPTPIRTTETSRDAEQEHPFPGTAAGDSEDDEATLVSSSSDAHVTVCQDSRDAEKVVLYKDNGPPHPISVIHRRILDHIPGFSDDEGDDVTRAAGRRRSPRTRTPTPPSRCWGVRATTHIEFEVVQEERAIPVDTALRPPPWHQKRE